MNKDCSYAFGNGANDLEMLKNVGHPYAMHNSETELLRAIKSVTDDVLDDGVYKQLKKLLLINQTVHRCYGSEYADHSVASIKEIIDIIKESDKTE